MLVLCTRYSTHDNDDGNALKNPYRSFTTTNAVSAVATGTFVFSRSKQQY